MIIVVPRYPDQDDRIAGRAARAAQWRAINHLERAGGPRVAVYDLENEQGTPIYVHAKAVMIDDVWAMVGSANLNRRSWTHDSEVACAVVDQRRDLRPPADPAGLGDGARVFARELRLRLCRKEQPDTTEQVHQAHPAKDWPRARRQQGRRGEGKRGADQPGDEAVDHAAGGPHVLWLG